METGEVILMVLGILMLVLISKRWFWILVFGIGGLASAFSCLASIFHFQILGALGFFVLAFILWGITGAIGV